MVRLTARRGRRIRGSGLVADAVDVRKRPTPRVNRRMALQGLREHAGRSRVRAKAGNGPGLKLSRWEPPSEPARGSDHRSATSGD